MVDRDLVVECESFQEVLDACATRLSAEGLFFESDRPAPLGSEVAFEVRIRKGFSVLRGAGEVVRVSDTGVFLRLTYLDQPSLKLMPKILEHYERLGIPLLELAAPEPLEPEPESLEPELPVPEPLAPEMPGPAVEPAEAMEVDPGAPIDIVEDDRSTSEPTADDLWPEEEAAATASAVGLTLNDLEAEFSSDTLSQDPVGGATEEDRSDSFEAASAGADGLMIDPEELIADHPVSDDTFAPDDIHLSALISAEEAAGLPKVEEVAAVEEVTALETVPEAGDSEASQQADGALLVDVPKQADEGNLDSGLSWLPEDEPEKRGRRGLWIFLLCIVLGAVLGVAFYFFFLRPGEASGHIPAEPVEPTMDRAAAAITESRSLPEPIAMAAELPDPGTTEAEPGEEQAPVSEGQPSATLTIAGEPLTGVDRITWLDEDGETVVIFWADGLFSPEQVDDFRVAGGEPREVVRIRGVRRPFDPQQIELDSELVRRIRAGFHQEANGAALHFVADLAANDVVLSRTEASGEQLRAYFVKSG